MAIIPQQDQDYLRDLFSQRLQDDVTLRFFTRPSLPIFVPGRQECQTCDDTHELLKELVALSDRLHLEVHNIDSDREAAAAHGVDRVPTIVLHGANKGTLRYIGVPAGYEFAGLIEDLIEVSHGATGLQPASRELLETLSEPVHIQVFVTPT